ncbi:hypothetical protein BGW80DRAFT_1251030 [Lactifluus volemus]|nr:hypothetical protein BGW80DRAFT_1251030 [Lactifluus volemus]
MLLLSLSLAFTLLYYSSALRSWAIPLESDGGILYRFSPTSSNETEELLAWAELRVWDLWQISHSHVDIYFPRRTVAEVELSLLPFHLSPTSSHHIDKGTTSRTHAGTIKHASFSEDQHWDVASPSNATFHSQYHPLDEINTFVRDLANAYPQQVSIIPLGHSGEGREMFALQITSGASAGHVSHDPNSQIVFDKKGKQSNANARCGFLITGAQHAREWIASASALYIAHALLADSSEEFSLARLLKRHNFYIIPVPNPDGYLYTWENDRFWYKNRFQVGPKARCVGIDMNRNWGYKWKASSNSLYGPEEDPCSHWFPGQRPFQAPEVNNMENYFSHLPRLKGFLDLRSYGQMLSTPFSHSCKKDPKDAEDQLEAISGAAHAMKKSHGTIFTTGPLCSTLYRAPGNIVDWVYKKTGVKYSFAAHLRDTGTYGFALPEQWIRPVGEESARMVESLADFIADKECH